MVNRIRTSKLNKGHGLKFHVGSQVQQTPEESWRVLAKTLNITIQMKTIDQKPLMIKIIKLRRKNSDN